MAARQIGEQEKPFVKLGDAMFLYPYSPDLAPISLLSVCYDEECQMWMKV
jgi:hypothetical protein